MFQELPLLNELREKFKHVDLSRVAMVTCQHTLQSIYINFQYLFDLGLKPENVFMVSKVYSYNKQVADALAAQGVHIHETSDQFNSHEPYDVQFTANTGRFVEESLEKIATLDIDKILIVDDGGYLLAKANTLSASKPMVGMEWTTAGYRKVLSSHLSLPVLNMARSDSKLRIESPIIAWGILTKTEEQYGHYFGSNKKALVIGAGPIGLAVKQQLEEKGKAVTIIDAHTPLPSTFDEHDLVIGCSGHNTIPEAGIEARGDVVLVSGSSSDREFPSAYIRRQSPLSHDSHQEFRYGGITLPNAGFPINFDGAVNFIPLEWIQITLGLAFASICTIASTPLKNGLNLFPIELDKEITNSYLRLR